MPFPTEVRRGTPLQRCDRLDALLLQLEGKGARISGSSRFRFYNALLRAFATSGETVTSLSEDEVLRVGIAAAETGELLESVDMLLRPPRVDGWLPIFQTAMGGHAIPVEGPDPARAAQFELAVAASCRKAGATPIFAEPDVRARVGTRTVAIAAKRLLSLSQLDKRTTEAREQIAKALSNEPDAQGIIAYDLTPALGFDRKVGRAIDVAEVGRQYQANFERVSVEARRVGERAGKEPRVRAAAVYARFSAVVTSSKSVADVRPWYCGPVPADAPTAAPLRRFLAGWGRLPPRAT